MKKLFTITALLAGLGAEVLAIDRAPIDDRVAAMPGVTFLKHNAFTLKPQDVGPWAAFDLSLGKAFYSGFTLGGLAISADGAVLRDDGSAIASSYAM